MISTSGSKRSTSRSTATQVDWSSTSRVRIFILLHFYCPTPAIDNTRYLKLRLLTNSLPSKAVAMPHRIHQRAGANLSFTFAKAWKPERTGQFLKFQQPERSLKYRLCFIWTLGCHSIDSGIEG